MKVKQGVDIEGIRPELLFGLMIAEGVFNERGEQLIVTSALDGEHMENSLHYEGLAADLRIPVTGPIRDIVDELQFRLGIQWDVIREPTHIHMEFDPEK